MHFEALIEFEHAGFILKLLARWGVPFFSLVPLFSFLERVKMKI